MPAYELYGKGEFREVTEQQVRDHQMTKAWVAELHMGPGCLIVFGNEAQAESYSRATGGLKVTPVYVRPQETIVS